MLRSNTKKVARQCLDNGNNNHAVMGTMAMTATAGPDRLCDNEATVANRALIYLKV
jgi:hypothetical protein